ncbi:Retrovirus-related Pol polyprotein from transposon TNT 1-94 [Gossypium australe]|uniref:Retrovirus-related Pol polyprotein from transposon TNT 1-94 n=1 Tax=Gossypium australe TaxID=47621 RepID=A0A5B6VEP2_9ROSI|nr:Retrovirus-related Pol polyprotein from transposon TNT 1-94 [Gossypium australe]
MLQLRSIQKCDTKGLDILIILLSRLLACSENSSNELKLSGYKIQALRSDNGKEYISDQLNLFCEEVGIEHQLTTPYTS